MTPPMDEAMVERVSRAMFAVDMPSYDPDKPCFASAGKPGWTTYTREARAAIEASGAQEPAGAWQLIETAPRDGTLILVSTGTLTGLARWAIIASRDTLNNRYEDGQAIAVFAHEYGWRSRTDKEINGAALRYWMPLPAPPVQP